MNRKLVLLLSVTAHILYGIGHEKTRKNCPPPPSEIEKYADEMKNPQGVTANSPGSLWNPNAHFLDIGSDLRASRPGDILSILVEEQSNAVANGTTKTQRNSSAQANISPVLGKTPPALANLVKLSSNQTLAGDGTTSRGNSLSASVSARVKEVLPNGFLVVEGTKTVTVNSETQVVLVRGVVRPVDISTDNIVRSDRLALVEIKINGKGVVNDAVRRPNFLYRLLLGLLPF